MILTKRKYLQTNFHDTFHFDEDFDSDGEQTLINTGFKQPDIQCLEVEVQS